MKFLYSFVKVCDQSHDTDQCAKNCFIHHNNADLKKCSCSVKCTNFKWLFLEPCNYIFAIPSDKNVCNQINSSNINAYCLKLLPFLTWDKQHTWNLNFLTCSAALCGMLFPGNEEAAYGNYRIWRSVGFILAYAYSPYLCTSTKIYILLALLIVGMFGYIIIEWGEMNTKRDNNCKN